MLDLTSDVVSLTAALVDIPSESRHEQQIADAVEAALRNCTHLEVQRFGNSLVARTEMGRKERVVLAGHLDTVPAADNLPHRIEDGRLLGLGANDMKGGVAVALRCAHEVTAPSRDVTYVFYECVEIDDTHNGLPLDHASKFYLYAATKGEVAFNVGLVIRADHEPNLTKFKNLLGVDTLELAPVEDAEKLSGAKSGFIGPVDLDVPIYVDASLDGSFNLTCGGNKTDFHHFGFKPDRDLKQFKGFHDLRVAKEGDLCPRCGKSHRSLLFM